MTSPTPARVWLSFFFLQGSDGFGPGVMKKGFSLSPRPFFLVSVFHSIRSTNAPNSTVNCSSISHLFPECRTHGLQDHLSPLANRPLLPPGGAAERHTTQIRSVRRQTDTHLCFTCNACDKLSQGSIATVYQITVEQLYAKHGGVCSMTTEIWPNKNKRALGDRPSFDTHRMCFLRSPPVLGQILLLRAVAQARKKNNSTPSGWRQ
jgi:hypothetical protein